MASTAHVQTLSPGLLKRFDLITLTVAVGEAIKLRENAVQVLLAVQSPIRGKQLIIIGLGQLVQYVLAFKAGIWRYANVICM